MDQAKVKSNFVWSGQDILGNYNLDHMEKIIESLNINDLERFLEESSLKVLNKPKFFKADCQKSSDLSGTRCA